MAKPVSILWSKAACIEAGADLADLQDRIVTESAKITAEARDWFVHRVPPDAEEECFVCTGRELPENWALYVQSGIFRAIPRSPKLCQRGTMISSRPLTRSEAASARYWQRSSRLFA